MLYVFMFQRRHSNAPHPRNYGGPGFGQVSGSSRTCFFCRTLRFPVLVPPGVGLDVTRVVAPFAHLRTVQASITTVRFVGGTVQDSPPVPTKSRTGKERERHILKEAKAEPDPSECINGTARSHWRLLGGGGGTFRFDSAVRSLATDQRRSRSGANETTHLSIPSLSLSLMLNDTTYLHVVLLRVLCIYSFISFV